VINCKKFPWGFLLPKTPQQGREYAFSSQTRITLKLAYSKLVHSEEKRRKKERRRKIETTGVKYNGLPDILWAAIKTRT